MGKCGTVAGVLLILAVSVRVRSLALTVTHKKEARAG